VFWDKHNERWVAKMEVNRKQICLGYFRNIEDAAKAYDKAAKEKFGEFAKTNENIRGEL
jgi:hypothetical protein